MEQEKREVNVYIYPRENEAKLLGIERGSSWDEINEERTRIYRVIKDVLQKVGSPVPSTIGIINAIENIKDAYELGLSFGTARDDEIEEEEKRLYSEIAYYRLRGRKIGYSIHSIHKYSAKTRRDEAKKLGITSKNPTRMEINEKIRKKQPVLMDSYSHSSPTDMTSSYYSM